MKPVLLNLGTYGVSFLAGVIFFLLVFTRQKNYEFWFFKNLKPLLSRTVAGFLSGLLVFIALTVGLKILGGSSTVKDKDYYYAKADFAEIVCRTQGFIVEDKEQSIYKDLKGWLDEGPDKKPSHRSGQQ